MRNGLLGCVVVLIGVGAAAAQPYGPAPLPPMPAMPFVMPPPPGMQIPGPAPGLMAPPFPQGMPMPPSPPPIADDGDGPADDGAERPHLCDHLWVEGDFIAWWLRDAHMPVLLTAGSPADAFPGAGGQPGTVPLYGGRQSFDAAPGGRFDWGVWTAQENGYHFGVQGDLFFLAQQTRSFAAASSGTQVLAQPFFDVRAGAQRAALLSFPGLQSGQFSADLTNRLWGAEIEARSEAVDTGVIHIDTLTGVRYIELRESLDLSDATTFAGLPTLSGLAVRQADHFAAENFFYGAEIGADGRADFGPLSLRLVEKVAFGATHQDMRITGSTNAVAPLGGSTTNSSGFYALTSNSGHFAREKFTIVPETRVALGYAVTQHIRATVGYDFLYVSNVLRPGDQINPALNTTQIPPPLGPGALIGPRQPAFSFNGTDFWAQGVDVGLEFRY